MENSKESIKTVPQTRVFFKATEYEINTQKLTPSIDIAL